MIRNGSVLGASVTSTEEVADTGGAAERSHNIDLAILALHPDCERLSEPIRAVLTLRM
jgi:hypothetical protein